MFQRGRFSFVRRFDGYGGNAFVRFGNGGLNAITDAWPSWMGLEDADRDSWEKTNAAREFLFRHRLRGEPSPFSANMARGFFDTLLSLYGRRAAGEGTQPVVILENIQIAEPAAADIVVSAMARRKDFLLAGVCAEDADPAMLAKWGALFPRKLRTGEKNGTCRAVPELPADLWEMGYLCSLIGRVFPPDLIPKVLEEMGKNSGMISRAVSLLHALRVIDTPMDPRPWQEGFVAQAEAALGEKKDGLRTLVRRRLLAWVARKKINHCASLLERLAELGGSQDMDDPLILQSIHGELSCTDGTALERFVDEGMLETVVGQARAPVVRYIAKTLLALHFGGEQKIRDTFACPPPECSAFPLLRTQTFLNQSLYHLGWHDGEAAKQTIKAATLLCQKSGNSWLSRCHRFFALASLSERRIGETNEYLGFALENAVKSGDPQEIGIASYYTASVQLLHGNLSRSLTLAKKALRHFLEAGSPEWADRSRFFEGRLAFENGSYGQAAEAFENLRDRPHGGCQQEKIDLLDAWIYRSGIYEAKTPAPRRPKGRIPDTDLFELEALYFRGAYHEIAELTEKSASAAAGEEFFYGTEQPDWRSGFAQCELLCFSWHDLRDRMLGAYRSLAKSYVSPQDGKTAVYSMQQILQNSRFAEIDPCDTFYHYVLYKILRQAGAGQIDLRTTASMAHKRLQVRSGRIDSPEIRRQYLTQPYWNRALEEAAKELNLL